MKTMESFMTLNEFNHHVYCLNAIQYVLKWFHSTFNHFVLKWFNSTLKLRSKHDTTHLPSTLFMVLHSLHPCEYLQLLQFCVECFPCIEISSIYDITCSKLVSFIGNGINQIHLGCVYHNIS